MPTWHVAAVDACIAGVGTAISRPFWYSLADHHAGAENMDPVDWGAFHSATPVAMVTELTTAFNAAALSF